MRVLHVVTDDDRRGAQIFAVDLLRALRSEGVEGDVVALAKGAVGGLELEQLGPSRTALRTALALRRRARSNDVVVAHGSTTLFACAAALPGSGVDFVYRQISDSTFWAHTRARRLRVRLGLRRASHIVALWEGAQTVLVDQFGVPAEDVTVIPNGVDPTRFAPAPMPRDEADHDRPLALCVMALVPEKGVADAIHAIAEVDVDLVVVGDGPDRTALESLAATMAPGRVQFVGAVTDLREFYRKATFLVFPSRGGDSMPAVVLEAAFCGLPVVTTDVAALREMVVDGETGFIVPPSDPAGLRAAIRDIVRDETRARALGEAGRRHVVGRYDIATVARRWREVLSRVIEPGEENRSGC